MKINSHGWLRTALHRLQCVFIVLWKYSNKRCTGAAALLRGRRLFTFPLHVRRLIEGGAYSSKYGIRKTMKCSYRPQWRMRNLVLILTLYKSSDAGKVYDPS